MRVPINFEDPLCSQVDTELFFPDKGDYYKAQVAKKICRRCPHLQECLEWALVNERHGVWGGTNARDRMAMRTKLGLKLREEYVA
jgi:WhiB family redox-sensing transcriptional regulator